MEIDSLRAIPFLANLSDSELTAFAALLESRDYKDGERILEEGTAPSAFQIVRDGVAHVRRRKPDGSERFLGRLGPGAFFADINLFDPGVATASIYAVGATRVRMIPYVRFRAFMEENPRAGYHIAITMLGEVARRLRVSDERLVNSNLVTEPIGTAWLG